ncbi:MAG: PQ-loop domain-containing transporter [Muribaculaceae bacterium]|nr:PQ-loop domain-containing transporter [Muribaculaceae bacterium]
MDIANIIGYIASVAMVLGYMPQALHTMRTRNTDGIAMSTFLLMGLGSLGFAIQGMLINNWPLIITNVLTTTSSVIISTIKVYNDYFKKK